MQQTLSELDLTGVSRIYATRYDCSPEAADAAIEEYRKFLAVIGANPGLKCVPSARQDRVWHICQEDSEKYQRDCMRLFGSQLEHDTDYFGTPAFHASWQATRDSTRRQFGVDPGQHSKAAACGGMLKVSAAKCGGMVLGDTKSGI